MTNHPSSKRYVFPETHWSLVGRTRAARPEERRRALLELCETYWPPVYSYARREGCSPEDAEDLTQGFFAQLLARGDLKKLRESKGKLRTFLIVSMKHFMANEWKRERRQKRGGGKKPISLDTAVAEEHYISASDGELAPDEIYDRTWALALLERVVKRLQEKYKADGRGAVFEGLKGHLTPRSDEGSYADLAGKLGLSENAVKVAVHRMRQRYGQLLREEIADTLGPDENIEDEIRHLFRVFS